VFSLHKKVPALEGPKPTSRSPFWERKFVCKFAKYEQIWGCGRSFAREDGFAAHLRTEIGWKCITSGGEKENDGLLSAGYWKPFTESLPSFEPVICKSVLEVESDIMRLNFDSAGCEGHFVALDDLLAHFQSLGGRKCIRPFLVEAALRAAKWLRQEPMDGGESDDDVPGNMLANLGRGENGELRDSSADLDGRPEDGTTGDASFNLSFKYQFTGDWKTVSYGPSRGAEGDRFEACILTGDFPIPLMLYSPQLRFGSRRCITRLKLVGPKRSNGRSEEVIRWTEVPPLSITGSASRRVRVVLGVFHGRKYMELDVGDFLYDR